MNLFHQHSHHYFQYVFQFCHHFLQGSPHIHAMCSLKNSPSVIETELAFKKEVTAKLQQDALEYFEKMVEIRTKLDDAANLSDEERDKFEHLKSQHDLLLSIFEARDSVLSYITEHLGISATHPNQNCYSWPKPYGTNAQEPDQNVLRQDLLDILKSEDSMMLSYERLIDRVQLHKHTLTYCLREKKKEKEKPDKETKETKESVEGDNAKEEAPRLQQEVVIGDKTYECRFGFDKPFFGYKATYETASNERTQILTKVDRQHHLNKDGTPSEAVVHPRGALITPGASKDKLLLYLRNHPALNETIKGNCFDGSVKNRKYVIVDKPNP